MSLRFLAGILLLVLACVLQFWFVWLGIPVNFALAALIAFAFLFGFWETAVFILIAIFLLNWQPAPSREMALLAILPLGAYCLHRLSAWQAWVGVLISVTLGIFLFYLFVAPMLITLHFTMFFTDLLSCLIFGALVFRALNRREGR